MCLYPVTIPNKRKINAVKSLVSVGVNPCDWLQGEPDDLSVPCGNCVECLQERSREWSYRCNEEKKHHVQNCCITLTYAETDGELNRRDVQLFLKRLRKHVAPVKIRYFGCGEYGSKGKRPHFHLIIFGYDFNDKYLWKRSKKGDNLFRSHSLEKLWTLGFSTVELLTINSARYMSLYFQKLNDFSEKKVRPFLLHSNRPGIGYASINESLIASDKLYCNGFYIKLPRYFLKVLERNNFDLEELKYNRYERSKIFLQDLPNYEERRKKILQLKKYFSPKVGILKPILTKSEKFIKEFAKNVKNMLDNDL